MKRIVLAALIVFPAVAAYADASSAKSIQTGNCGGIRGGCRGYEVQSDGTILRTESGSRTKDTKVVICKNEKTTKLLFEKLNKTNFTSINMNEKSNIYAYIALEAEGIKHQVSWWQKDETTKQLNDFIEEEMLQLREINCTGDGK
jgi:hypothetical protein